MNFLTIVLTSFSTSFLFNNLHIAISFITILILKNWVHYYKFDTIADQINTNDLLKKIKADKCFSTMYSIKDGIKKPEGIFFNNEHKYIGYINNYTINNNYTSKTHSTVWIIGYLPITIKNLSLLNNDELEESESDITKQNTTEDNPIEKRLKYIKLFLSSNYYDGSFKEICLPFEKWQPLHNQIPIIENINNTYNSHPFCICRTLLWGTPGMGKSFIGKLLAHKYKSAYCFDIKLTQPGTPLLTLWETYKPTKEQPLIVQIDEFDILLNKIHNNNQKENSKSDHQWLKTLVYDKQSYNTFMSEYLICLPYVIYLFTMNSNPDDIDTLDKSYIRKNRIDLILTLLK